ncbi:unnamed protein product, partial [Heterotrigona itama]
YAEEVINNFRFVVLCAIVVSTIALTLCGVTLIMDSPLIMKMRFVVISLTVLTEIYIYAWPADYMKDMSMHVSRSAYDLIWYKQTLIMQKNLLNVLAYQKPVTFSISFIIPDLSLRYYCSLNSNEELQKTKYESLHRISQIFIFDTLYNLMPLFLNYDRSS